jgi:hypothetical protein
MRSNSLYLYPNVRFVSADGDIRYGKPGLPVDSVPADVRVTLSTV